MYHDSIRNKDVYKPSVSRKNIGLTYFYYDFETKEPVQIKGLKLYNKSYSKGFIRNYFNYIDTNYNFDFDSAYRTIKIQKLIKNI